MTPTIITATVLLIVTLGWSYVLLRRLREWRAGLLIASLGTSAALLSIALGGLIMTGTPGLPMGPTGLLQVGTGCLLVAAVIHFNVAVRKDALTGLPNRTLLMLRIGRALKRVDRGQIPGCAILLLDVDRLKVVNESLGHGLGDRLLAIVARRLLASVRKGDTVARLGGDEFVVLLQGVDRSSAARAAERLQGTLSRPITLKDQEVFSTVSIGIAVTTSGGDTAETMLRKADVAMHRAKMLGKSRHAVFDVWMGESTVARLQLETDLRHAAEREELYLHYQPIVSLEEARVVGLEALLRWRHGQRGLLMPGTFIPLAEETGLIVPIGLWVLEEACHQMRSWQDRFPTLANALVHVNLSGQQFTQPDLVDQITNILVRTGLAPECLGLEMTETVMMSDAQQTTSILSQLRALNVKLQLDDFGTGYSSLSYLHRFPITSLKIDRSFVMAMHTKEEHAKIVRSINTLARDLQLEVIAEGIETPEQLELLRSWGCEFGQGNYLCAATDREVVESILAGESIPGQPLKAAQVVAN
jgi:diguanylate cyclase (GGDEF)-like protein